MALNPEIVADLLFAPLNNHCVGDWYQNGHTPRMIEQKARERATTPESFVDWLIVQNFFCLRSGVDKNSLRASLIESLQKEHPLLRLEDVREQTHNILFIEQDKIQADIFESLFKMKGKSLGIPKSNIQFKHVSLPSMAPGGLKNALQKYTGLVIHDTDLEELSLIRDDATTDPILAKKLVIVKYGGTRTSQHETVYQALENAGAMVIIKPFVVEEVLQVLFGLV